MSTWTRPKPKMYEYNYNIQSSQYRPTLSILDKKEQERSTKTVVTKIRGPTVPADEQPSVPTLREVDELPLKKFEYYSPNCIAGSTDANSVQYERFKKDSSEALQTAKKSLDELEERQFPAREPLWKVHPYYVPVERESVPPHEDSIWPESRKHFDLVSSYDCMVGFLGIRGMAEREMTKNVTRET